MADMKYKDWVYGVQFSGKSHFADTFPRPYVINTDGNLQFYKNAEGIVVSNYAEFVQALQGFDTDKYDTLVIDVLDHVYDLCREEFLQKNGIEHEADLRTAGGAETFGKGWTLLREQFWYMISKITTVDANVVLISHDEERIVKGKLGTERTMYTPATIPKKITKKLSGRVHFMGRCLKDEQNQHKISFGDSANEDSGYRLPLESLLVNNDYESFINNIIGG